MRTPQPNRPVEPLDNSSCIINDYYQVEPSNFSASLVQWRYERRLELRGLCWDTVNGVPIPDCDLTFSAVPVARSGGHEHDNPGRGRGRIVSPGVSCLPDGSCTEIAGGNTGPDGYFEFDYVSPEEGGQITFTMTGSKTGYVIPPLTATFSIVVYPLHELPQAGTGYLFDASAVHDQHHRWGTSEFNSLWEQVPGRFTALVQRNLPPGTVTPVIQSYGTSLICGGLFDHPGQWTPPHRGHRLGRENDVRHRQMQPQFWGALARAFRDTCVASRPGFERCFDFRVPDERPDDPGSDHWHAAIFEKPIRRQR